MKYQRDIDAFLDALGIEDIDSWNPLKTWAQNDKDKNLTVPVGMTRPGGHIQFAHFGKNIDNETGHVILEGPSGSGKTVAITDILLGLAMKYSPDRFQVIYGTSKITDPIAPDLPHVLSVHNTRFPGNGYLEKVDEMYDERRSPENYMTLREKYSENTHTPKTWKTTIIVSEEPAGSIQGSALYSPMSKRIMRSGRELDMHILLATQNIVSVGNTNMYDNALLIEFHKGMFLPFFLLGTEEDERLVLKILDKIDNAYAAMKS